MALKIVLDEDYDFRIFTVVKNLCSFDREHIQEIGESEGWLYIRWDEKAQTLLDIDMVHLFAPHTSLLTMINKTIAVEDDVWFVSDDAP